MQKELTCYTCKTETIIIENKLFFSEKKKTFKIICPSCNNKITEEHTDGWFFVQSKIQYTFQLEIDSQKEKIKFGGSI